VILKREGSRISSLERKNDVAMLKRDGKWYQVTVKFGDAQWWGILLRLDPITALHSK
jgi:hypothetical protein